MTHEVIAQLKKAYYAGYEECEKGDANCFTGWREWASQLQSTQEGGTMDIEQVYSKIDKLARDYDSYEYGLPSTTDECGDGKDKILAYLKSVSATDKARIEELEKEVERLRGLVEEAHLNGFKLSGEGWNGEYPFNDCKVEIKTDETYNAYWEQFKADNNL